MCGTARRWWSCWCAERAGDRRSGTTRWPRSWHRHRPVPLRHYAINSVWLELSLAAADLLAWAQTMLLDGTLAKAEPRTLRYRPLHVAARITRGQRRTFLRIDAHWPWRNALAAAFARLQAIPQPIT